MSQPLISFIIPIYNGELFIESCVHSILNQTFDNYEVILINDGSNDRSPEICKKLALENEKIFCISQTNQGVSAARNYGVTISRGLWIIFVDIDDILPLSAFDSIEEHLLDDYDIIIACALLAKNNFSLLEEPNISASDSILNRKSFQLRLIKGQEFWTPWAKIYKKTLFDKNTFNIPREITCGEDFIMNLRIASKTKKIKFIKDVIYYYNVPENINVHHPMKLKTKIRSWIEMFRYTNLSFPIKIYLLVMKIYRIFFPKQWSHYSL